MKKLEGRPFAARTRDALGRALLFACARSRTTDPTTGLDIVREELLGLIPWRDSAWSNGVKATARPLPVGRVAGFASFVPKPPPEFQG